MGSWLRNTSGESKVNMNKFQVITILSSVVCLTQSQLSFGKGGSGSSSSSSSSSTSNRNGNTKPDTDQRIISTGDSFVDGGILGVGAGLLGGAVLSGALNGGNIITTTPAADARDRRTTGRRTPGSWALCLVEATAEAATVAEGKDKPRMREMWGPGSLGWTLSWEVETTTTAAATADTLTTTTPTITPLTTTTLTTTTTTFSSSSVSVITT